MATPGVERPGAAPTDEGRSTDAVLAVARSAAASLVSVVLPIAMTRLYGADRFAVWTIGLQAFLYSTFLESGLTLAVSRTAAARSRLRTDDGAEVLRSGLTVAALPLTGALLLYGALLLALPRIYGNLPRHLVGTTRTTVALMAIASLATIRSFPSQGFLMGTDRFARAVVPVAAGTAGAALAAISVAALGGGPAAAAAGFAAARIATAVMLERSARSGRGMSGTETTEGATSHRSTVRELRAMVGTLWIWSFAGFLGTGLDLTLVSWADYRAVRPYAISAAITSVLTGVAGALGTVVVPRIARAAGSLDDVDLLDRAARRARIDAWIIGCVAVPLVAAAGITARILGGRVELTLVLLLGAWLRMSMTPLVSAMVGAGDHRALRRSPLVEGGVNLSLGIVLAPTVGAIGVAAATLVSGALGVALHLVHNLPRTSLAGISAARLVQRIHAPAILVLGGCALVGSDLRTASPRDGVVVLLTAIVGIVALSRLGLTAADRAWVRRVVAGRTARSVTPPPVADARR